ncbi:UNVERIFIED_CONTAM: hypothetical protein PYX00_003383 [Menopon gallinae]|uniref:Uncharacterized protein n=1 Tax=Menopon gallinae TaxID=328185 RepID=A0AAW2HZM3_9NEOP
MTALVPEVFGVPFAVVSRVKAAAFCCSCSGFTRIALLNVLWYSSGGSSSVVSVRDRWKQDLAVVEWNLHWDTPTADGSLYSSKINVEGRLTIGGWLHECLHVVSSTKLKSAGVDISSGTVVGPYTTPTSPTAQQQLTSWKS